MYTVFCGEPIAMTLTVNKGNGVISNHNVSAHTHNRVATTESDAYTC